MLVRLTEPGSIPDPAGAGGGSDGWGEAGGAVEAGLVAGAPEGVPEAAAAAGEPGSCERVGAGGPATRISPTRASAIAPTAIGTPTRDAAPPAVDPARSGRAARR